MTLPWLRRWHNPWYFKPTHHQLPQPKIPLRLVLTVPFVLLTVSTTGLVGYLSWRNGQQSINSLTNQLMREIDHRVVEKLDAFLAAPHLINASNLHAVELGEVNLNDFDGLGQHFFRQLDLYPNITSVVYANEQGEIIGYRHDSGQREMTIATTAEPGVRYHYRLDDRGQRTYLTRILPDYDPRVRPWYKVAKQIGTAAWSPIYPWSIAPDVAITAVLPTYKADETLEGVFAVDILLRDINRYLRQIFSAYPGQIFIVESSGELVATSTAETPFVTPGNRQASQRLQVSDSKDPITQAVSQQLIEQFGSFDQINHSQQLRLFVPTAGTVFVQVTPYQHTHGLTWLIVTVLPESHFMAEIQENTRTMLLLCLSTLGTTIALGLWLSQSIVRPIQRLGQASLALADGEWEMIQPNSAVAELQVLNTAFDRMAAQLQQSFDRVKTALYESEEKFTHVFRTCPDPIGIATIDGYYLEVNDAFVNLFGYAREEVIGCKATEVGHWDNPEARQRYVQLVQAGQPVRNLEFTFRSKVGNQITVLFSADSIELQGQPYIVGIAKDITDRKQVEEALRHSEARFQRLTAAAPGAIYTLVKRPDHSFYFEYVSPAIEAINELTVEQMLTNPDQILIHPDDQAKYEAAVAHSATTLTAFSHEFRIITPSGKVKWLHANSRPEQRENGEIAWYGIVLDVSDQKYAEAALRQSEERWQLAISGSNDGIWDHNLQTNTHYLSPRCMEMLGYSYDEVDTFDKWVQHIHPDDIGRLQATFQAHVEHQLPSYACEYRIRCKDGSYKWLLARGQALWDEQGIPVRAVGSLTDISDRKQAEEALRHSEARFQKIAAASPAQIYILTCEPDGHQMRFEYISPGVREIQELEPEQVLANPSLTYEQIHPDDRQIYNKVAYRSFQTLQPFSHEWRIITASGKLKWVQANSRPERQADGRVVWYGVMLDITERKLAEEALRYSEAALRRAQQVAHIGSWEVDVATEQVIWSEESFHIFGWDITQPEPNLAQFYELIYPDDRLNLQQLVADIITNGGSYRTEFRITQPNGLVRYVEARGEAIRNEQGQIVQLVGTNLDITERRAAEEALRKSEATKNQILKAIPDLIIWMTAAGTCIDLIDGGSVTNLYVKSEAVGKNLYDLLPFDLAQARMNAIQQALQTGEVQIYEQYVFLQDGVRYEEVRVIGVEGDKILVIVRDVTDRKQAEAALLDSESRFRSAFWDAPIGMALISPDDRWIKVNPKLCNMLGYSESELLTMKTSMLVHPEDMNRLQHSILQIELDEKQSAQAELRYHCRNGQMAWGLVNLSVVRDAQGRPLYYVAHIQDITERQAIDRIKNEFISIVSHELRTPLTAIRGFLGLLDTGIYDQKPDKAKHMIGQALANSDRLVRLVNDILDLERLSSGRVQLVMEVCQADTLIQQAVAGVQSIADQAIVTLTIIPATVQVWADPDSIIQTLTNLLSNAIKFSPPNSIITLSAQVQSNAVLFSVTDQGRGIPTDKLETIFGRFQQVDVSDSRQKGGTGLGLAICQSIVQQHGGNIWAESTLGEGSTFYFTVPFPPGGGHD